MNTLLAKPQLSANPTTMEKTAALCSAATARHWTKDQPQARILYVDNDPQRRTLSELALAQSGYDVDTAADGVEAWAALHDVNYNLLVADQEMPRLGGLELAAQARLAGMRLPIVLASDSTDSLRDPADAWLNLAARLEKPFAVDSLIQTVEQTLRAANNLHQCSSTMISVLAHIANVQPYPHGGINE